MTRIALTRTCDAYKYTCIDAAIVQNLHIHDAMVVSGWNTSPLQMVTHNVLSYSFQTANGNSTAMATSSVFFFCMASLAKNHNSKMRPMVRGVMC